ncbi:hypothetical protein PWT90_05273 [Aphanocladium album]|nr:hypothetical protein PWT90_05273 [Aphanocladium album]
MSVHDNINGLAAQIAELATGFNRSLADANIPEPDFTSKSPINYDGLTPEMFLRRQELLDKITDMWYLVQGPSEGIFNYAYTIIPLDGSASVADIANHANLPEEVVKRVVKHGTALRLFSPEGNYKVTQRVQHSSRSAALVKSSGLRALVFTVLDDAEASMLAMNKALELHSRGRKSLGKDMTKTAFATHQKGATIGNHTTSWEFMDNDGDGERKGWRQRNFVELMRYLKEIFRLESVLETACDWKALGKATIVDIGGSGGHDAFFLAQKYPDIKFIVEDLPEVEPAPQPTDADVSIFKMTLHDWPDDECVKILRALLPAMKPGSRVFFIDFVGKHDTEEESQPPVPRSMQQMGTATDLLMMALFNGKERPAEAWRAIFKAADQHFDIVRLEAKPLAFFVIIEAVWRG